MHIPVTIFVCVRFECPVFQRPFKVRRRVAGMAGMARDRLAAGETLRKARVAVRSVRPEW